MQLYTEYDKKKLQFYYQLLALTRNYKTLVPLCISVDKYVKRRQRFSPRCHHREEMHERVRDSRDNLVEWMAHNFP